jgi:hypothetical protein
MIHLGFFSGFGLAIGSVSVEIGGTSHLNELQAHPQRPPRGFCSFQRVLFRAFGGITWIPEDSDPTDSGNGLGELFQTLAY